jgi:5-oxoprolinase (ATP-hydrolysing) subunit A
MSAPRAGASRIDLNADAGEGFDSPELFAAISSASIACGGHAGDGPSMRRAVELALEHGVAVGAHPGYEDRERFGRVETGAPAAAIGELVTRQVARLLEAAAAAGARLAHVKPHGALYHRVTGDAAAAQALVAAVVALDPRLAIFGFPGSQLLAASRAAELPAIAEGFADRRYGEDGLLVSRQRTDPRLDARAAIAQALRLASEGRVRTICVHSDAAGAAELAAAIRRALEERSFAVAPPRQ